VRNNDRYCPDERPADLPNTPEELVRRLSAEKEGLPAIEIDVNGAVLATANIIGVHHILRSPVHCDRSAAFL
jgi:hypothetical protein